MKTLPRYMQQGGSISQEEATNQVVQVISNIAGVSTDQVMSKLQEISQDEKAVEMLSQALELANKGDEQGIQWIKQTFGSKFAKGGKIHDFVCKHARGGNCGCNKVEKGLNGMSMGDALNGAMDAYGYNMSQARNAYTNAKNALRSSGLRGRELRQQARQMISSNPLQNQTSTPRFRLDQNTMPSVNERTASITTPEAAIANGGWKQPEILNKLDGSDWIPNFTDRGSFNAAFAAARDSFGPGIKFKWNGKLYTTDLANKTSNTVNSTPSANNNNFSVWNNDYTRRDLGREEAMESAADKYGVVLFDRSGGKVEKAQREQRQVYAKCGKKIKKGQFGIAGMPINPKVVKAVYDKMDNFLTPANKWEKEHGTPVIGGLGLPAYVSPVAQEIELAKIIGNRIPTQMSAEKNAAYSIKAASEKQKAIDAATKAGKIYIEPKIPADWDIDLPMFDSKFDIPDLNNIIKFSWPKFIGRNVLLPASGVVGSAAAGSYIATKKDKNKKSENK